MKKITFFVIALIACISLPSGAFEISPIIGYRSNMPSSTSDGYGYQNTSGYGLKFGALARFEFSSTWALRLGAVWNQRDFDGKVDFSAAPLNSKKIDVSQKVSYLDFPLNLEWATPLTGLYIFGGYIYASKLADSYTYSPTLNSLGIAEANKHELTNSDQLLNLGIGYSFEHFNNTKYSLEIEYENGLTNINNTAGSSDKILQRALVLNLICGLDF